MDKEHLIGRTSKLTREPCELLQTKESNIQFISCLSIHESNSSGQALKNDWTYLSNLQTWGGVFTFMKLKKMAGEELSLHSLETKTQSPALACASVCEQDISKA